VNPPEVTIEWYEPFNKLFFRIGTLRDAPNERSASIDIEVFANDLPVSSMRLAIVVAQMQESHVKYTQQHNGTRMFSHPMQGKISRL
jgi:hypothetical protein